MQGAGCRVQGSWFWVQGSGFWVQGSGFQVQGSGCRVQGLGFRVDGLGLRGWELGSTQKATWHRTWIIFSVVIFLRWNGHVTGMVTLLTADIWAGWFPAAF